MTQYYIVFYSDEDGKRKEQGPYGTYASAVTTLRYMRKYLGHAEPYITARGVS